MGPENKDWVELVFLLRHNLFVCTVHQVIVKKVTWLCQTDNLRASYIGIVNLAHFSLSHGRICLYGPCLLKANKKVNIMIINSTVDV